MAAGPASSPSPSPAGLSKIQHVIVIMQENRSFDHYFGTFPGVDGLARQGDQFTTCIPDPVAHACGRPYHDAHDANGGGPHAVAHARADINGGKMDGFIDQAERGARGCTEANNPICTNSTAPDVMGWKDARDIPNYWAYASQFVLQDHMFEPDASWSLPQHLFLVSGWSARCSQRGDPASCRNEDNQPDLPGDFGNPNPGARPNYAWTDLTYLLQKRNVSWKYYVAPGTEPDCEDPREGICVQRRQNAGTPGIWNPMPWFTTVQQNKQLTNIQDLSHFYDDARNGQLPAVSWIVPNNRQSEHPPSLVSAGQAYVTDLVNAVMRSSNWSSTAIFISWDDWGGFYDHVVPPTVDQNGYGLRVPGLVISPYAKKGFVDHQVLSHDAYVKFMEDVFLGGQRIDPATDGRPDQRPTVRENVPLLGDLANDFDFNQPPRRPLVLNPHPSAGPASIH